MPTAMRLADLARVTLWEDVAAALLQLFPGRKEQISAYRGLFDELGAMVPSPQVMRISIEEEFIPPDGVAIVQVLGRDGTLQRDLPGWPDLYEEHAESPAGSVEATFTLCSQRHSAWAGMTIEPMTLERFTRGEILARVLVDMTRLGFTDAARQAALDTILLDAHKSEMQDGARYH